MSQVSLQEEAGHWRSLLHHDCRIIEGPLNVPQMCLQLAGCSQHHPLTWNVSRDGDDLLGFIFYLPVKNNPIKGRLCNAHIS